MRMATADRLPGDTMRTFLGFTWVGWLNLLALQFFFVRLVHDGRRAFAFVGPVLPLTGWISGYVGFHHLWRFRE